MEGLAEFLYRPLPSRRPVPMLKPRVGDVVRRRPGTTTGQVRKRSSAGASSGGDSRPTKRKKPVRAGGGGGRSAIDDTAEVDDAAAAAERHAWYAADRAASQSERMSSLQPDAVASTHDEKGGIGLWISHKNTVKQLRQNAAAARGGSTSSTCCALSVPRHGFEEIEEVRCAFIAANRGLKAAERRFEQARKVEVGYLRAARAQITARCNVEENLRLALANAHPYWDLVRLRLTQTLRQSIADTAKLVSLSKTVALSHASCRALAKARMTFFEREKLACRYNREVVVCRVNGTGDSSASGEGLKPLRLRRTGCHRKFSVSLPRMTKALDDPQASVPDPGVSPRMGLVLSQLNVIASAAANSTADKSGGSRRKHKG